MTRTSGLDWGRHYLLCPPEHYRVTYSINPWMDLAVTVDPERAREQWEALRATLVAAGARVEVLPAEPDLPDMVFTANSGIVDGATFLPSRMRHPERRPESDHAARWAAAAGFGVRELPAAVVQEGSGDALPVCGALVMGYRARSSAAAAVALARMSDAAVVPVELADPRWYHVDLTLCPLDERRAMVFPDAFDADGRRAVAELVAEPLVLTPDEAAVFAANSVVVGTTVVMPQCPPRVGRQLEAWGFDVVEVDVSEFRKAGGAVRCLTLALDVTLSSPGAALAGTAARAVQAVPA